MILTGLIFTVLVVLTQLVLTVLIPLTRPRSYYTDISY